MSGPFRTALNVLVVDDDARSREDLARAVRGLGHWCALAVDGAEAFERHRERPYDVLLSDWDLPHLSGIDLCQKVRLRDGEDGYTYFIFVTALHDRQHVLAGMCAGADDYLAKPVNIDTLEARLLAAERIVALQRRRHARAVQLRHDSDQLFAVAHTDPLTGVGNRLRLDQDLAELWPHSRDTGVTWSVAMIDVDDFKQHNDRFGHLAGDDA
ncbi:MAG: response regulator, partial [Polyangiales bacterium]